ncbi:uncharacterized protein PV06_06161 [Exophiala oligosperma]|uniref:HCNGP-like protein n=2 Tax=Chaetothyriales TaxID=34395 RepID=A0A0D2DJL0_9EURO|nr:uncharacterized protein PV06_06161 [Exophiala oligosperma]KAJ9633545.1 hypothetical protein H2204_006928 [Knufia peltigerae]KIW42630.1 hypothetical protein PV06_06161 [Exophiala oligosperma]
MSALVAYESSSDEDEVADQDAGRDQVATTTIAKGHHDQNGDIKFFVKPSEPSPDITAPTASVDCVAPMVGPSMPSQMDSEVEQEDPLSELQQSMSERDIVHQLTFASHPMASLPPSPPGSPDPVLEVKFKKFLDLKTKGMHFNEDLASKSAFRNPGLLATMMVRIGLDEEDQYRTSLPHQVWNPTGFPKSAYKEELLRAQQTLRDQDLAAKKSLSAQGKRTIEFMPGGRSGDSSRDSTPGMPNKRKRP